MFIHSTNTYTVLQAAKHIVETFAHRMEQFIIHAVESDHPLLYHMSWKMDIRRFGLVNRLSNIYENGLSAKFDVRSSTLSVKLVNGHITPHFGNAFK